MLPNLPLGAIFCNMSSPSLSITAVNLIPTSLQLANVTQLANLPADTVTYQTSNLLVWTPAFGFTSVPAAIHFPPPPALFSVTFVINQPTTAANSLAGQQVTLTGSLLNNPSYSFTSASFSVTPGTSQTVNVQLNASAYPANLSSTASQANFAPLGLWNHINWTLTGVTGIAPFQTYIELYILYPTLPPCWNTKQIPLQLLRYFVGRTVADRITTRSAWMEKVAKIAHGSLNPFFIGITDTINNLFKYQVWWGEGSLVNSDGTKFSLEYFTQCLDRIKMGQEPTDPANWILVNCYDQAAIAWLGLTLGLDYTTVAWEYKQVYGFLRDTPAAALVGWGPCNNPYFCGDAELQVLASDDSRREPFRNHAFLSVGTNPVQVGVTDKTRIVIDACAGPVYDKTYYQYEQDCIQQNLAQVLNDRLNPNNYTEPGRWKESSSTTLGNVTFAGTDVEKQQSGAHAFQSLWNMTMNSPTDIPVTSMPRPNAGLLNIDLDEVFTWFQTQYTSLATSWQNWSKSHNPPFSALPSKTVLDIAADGSSSSRAQNQWTPKDWTKTFYTLKISTCNNNAVALALLTNRLQQIHLPGKVSPFAIKNPNEFVDYQVHVKRAGDDEVYMEAFVYENLVVEVSGLYADANRHTIVNSLIQYLGKYNSVQSSDGLGLQLGTVYAPIAPISANQFFPVQIIVSRL